MARDLACAALGWALALVTWIAASRLQRSLLSDAFGADGLPKGLALALAAVSTVIAVRAVWKRAPATGDAAVPLTDHAKALAIVAIGFAYVLLAPWAGYAVAVGLVILVTAWHYGARVTPTLALVAAAGAVFFWLLFARMLSVSLPSGFWPGLLG